uniref:Kinesin motor domain-containing protein n=1 Tax=Leersia perrieri TaxID=77586 RepID=A0A0D9VB19_9ORYZ
MEPPTAGAGAASPPAPTTLRRNPPRSARPPPTPLTKQQPSSLSRLLDEEAAAAPSASATMDRRLKVFLRIRPLPPPSPLRKSKAPKPKQPPNVCLVANGANSVALTVPNSKLLDPKRARTEVFDGFSAIFSPDSSQHDVFSKVMNPLVDEFLGGKSALLVAMGPTGSGKTHTVFGSPRNPGLLPLTLQHIFSATDQSSKGICQSQRSFCFSMFEILSEGKGERILDLLSDATDIVFQQSTIKGLKEVFIENFADAKRLVLSGMLKRSTAATNANSNRSQCIITIRAIHKNTDVESEKSLNNAVLTIADLAGAEREKKTGNQGTRLLESNFINNTSMVFGLCLRSLLEHQKNKKKPLEKHFKNSMLTRYLKDYLEGRKKMTLILNVKPGDDDYLDSSFLLRQASPYMKIKYTNLENFSEMVSQKRSNVSLICQENIKKRKVHKNEVVAVAGKNAIDKDASIKVSEQDESHDKILDSELRRVSRNEEIMTKFARALWTVLKQYKQKLLESENAAESTKKLLRCKDIKIMELEKKLMALSCSCKKFPTVEDTSVEQSHDVSSGQVAESSVSLSSQTNLGSSDSALNDFHSKRANLSPQFIGASKGSPIEQSEEERDELHIIAVEEIEHNVDITGVEHRSTPSCSQQVNSEALDVSSSHSSLQLQGMGALQQDPQVLSAQSERFEPTVEKTIVEYGCIQPPQLVDDHGGMYPRGLNGKSCPTKAPIAPIKDSQSERPTDKTEDLPTSNPCNRKNTRRRLRPVSAMMLKEFTAPDIFLDTRKEETVKLSSDAIGRSDKLIRLLKAHPPRGRA